MDLKNLTVSDLLKKLNINISFKRKVKTKYLICYDADKFAYTIYGEDESKLLSLSLDESKITTGGFLETVENSILGVTQKFNDDVCDIYLPHFCYGVDYATIPDLGMFRSGTAFTTEMKSRYKNFDDLVFVKQEIGSGKGTKTYAVLYVRKSILTSLEGMFKKIGIKLNRFIPYACASCENILEQNTSARRHASVLLDVGFKSSLLIYHGKGAYLGALTIPFGTNALSPDRVIFESSLYRTDTSELVVVNARERAKSTRLSMAINFDEEIVDEPQQEPISEQSEAENSEVVQEAEENEEVEIETEVQEVKVKQQIKVAKKKTTKIPKALIRDVPTSSDGFIQENFRLFERKILMFAREMAYVDNVPKIDNVVINIPEKYLFIENELNEQDKHLKWTTIKRSTGVKNNVTKLPVFTL